MKSRRGGQRTRLSRASCRTEQVTGCPAPSCALERAKLQGRGSGAWGRARGPAAVDAGHWEEDEDALGPDRGAGHRAARLCPNSETSRLDRGLVPSTSCASAGRTSRTPWPRWLPAPRALPCVPGGLPLPARLSPLMGPIRRRPVGAVSTSDCAATPSLLFTYSAAFQAPSGHGHCSRFSVSFLVRALPGVSCGSDTDRGRGCQEPGSLRYFMLPRSHLHPEPRRLVLRAGAT